VQKVPGSLANVPETSKTCLESMTIMHEVRQKRAVPVQRAENVERLALLTDLSWRDLLVFLRIMSESVHQTCLKCGTCAAFLTHVLHYQSDTRVKGV